MGTQQQGACVTSCEGVCACGQAKRRVYTLQRASGDRAKAKRKRQGADSDAGAPAGSGQQQKDAVEAVPVLEEMPKWQQVQVILQVRPLSGPNGAADPHCFLGWSLPPCSKYMLIGSCCCSKCLYMSPAMMLLPMRVGRCSSAAGRQA